MNSYFLWESQREQWYKPNKLAYTHNPLLAGVYEKEEAVKICSYSSGQVEMYAVDSDFVKTKNLEYMTSLKTAIESLTEELNPSQLDLLFKELILASEERFRKNLMMDAILGAAFSQ